MVGQPGLDFMVSYIIESVQQPLVLPGLGSCLYLDTLHSTLSGTQRGEPWHETWAEGIVCCQTALQTATFWK